MMLDIEPSTVGTLGCVWTASVNVMLVVSVLDTSDTGTK